MFKRNKKIFVQLAEYMVAGGAYFWSGYFIIVFLTPVIGLWWANLLGNGVGVTVNFILERYWVFEGTKKRTLTEVSGRYVIFTACNFILNYLILRALISVGIKVALGQFVAAGFFTIWNYLWYRNWVFKDKPQAGRIRHHA
ncbi:MAG TPA: GtrA family protein [Patescibacteria group bacterium]|nr:GtrA family protein [Patescibacteria group bacterium]